MNPPLDLIIFDCDGVLVDSEIIGITLTRSLLAEHGVAIGFEEFCTDYSGLHWDTLIARVQATTGVALPANLYQTFYAALLAEFDARLTRIAGTLEVISTLDLPKCICSNSASAQLERMLTQVGLQDLFAGAVYSAVDLGPGRGKPLPDIFLHAAACFGADPARTLVIEDSVPGVTAARRAGMRVIGFTGGAHTFPQHGDRLLAAGADRLMAQMAHLPQVLAGLT